MARPMYRQDWGGRTPTVDQQRAANDSRDDSRDLLRQARADYERLSAAYDASDKSQDANLVHCRCGASYDGAERFNCPECGAE